MSQQAYDAVRTMAPFVRAYYCAVVEAGFSPEEALALTIGWQAAWIARLSCGAQGQRPAG